MTTKVYVCKRPGYRDASWVGALIVAARTETLARHFCQDRPGDQGFEPESIDEFDIADDGSLDAFLIHDDHER